MEGKEGDDESLSPFQSASAVGGPDDSDMKHPGHDGVMSEEDQIEMVADEDDAKNSPFEVHINRTVSVSGATWDEIVRRAREESKKPRTNPDGLLSRIPVFGPQSLVGRFWTTLMMIVDATYTAMLLPIVLAFELGLNNGGGGPAWLVVEIVAGALTVVDVFMGFNIGFIATSQLQKRLVTDRKVVAWFYICHYTFWFDLLAALAFLIQVSLHVEDVESIPAVHIIKLLRYVRVINLVRRLMKSMTLGNGISGVLGNPALIGGLSLLYLSAVLVNFLGCFWFWVARREGLGTYTWLEDVFLVIPPSPEYPDGWQASLASQYLASVYFAITTITTVGYGDITPTTSAERGAAIAIMLVGLVFFTILLTTIVELVQSAGKNLRRGALFSEKMHVVRKWMARRNLSDAMRTNIEHFYSSAWLRLQELAESEVLGDLPHDLRGEAVLEVVGPMMRKLKMFRSMESVHLQELCARMRSLIVPRGHCLAVEGDSADCLWLLERGEISVHQFERQVQLLNKTPVVFGELALLGDQMESFRTRTLSFRAEGASRLWVLPMGALKPVLALRPEVEISLLDGLKDHLEERRAALPPAAQMRMDGVLDTVVGRRHDVEQQMQDLLEPGTPSEANEQSDEGDGNDSFPPPYDAHAADGDYVPQAEQALSFGDVSLADGVGAASPTAPRENPAPASPKLMLTKPVAQTQAQDRGVEKSPERPPRVSTRRRHRGGSEDPGIAARQADARTPSATSQRRASPCSQATPSPQRRHRDAELALMEGAGHYRFRPTCTPSSPSTPDLRRAGTMPHGGMARRAARARRNAAALSTAFTNPLHHPRHGNRSAAVSDGGELSAAPRSRSIQSP